MEFLTWQSFVLHIINLIVLYVLLRVLLYKPVSEFMRKRKEKYEEEINSISEREHIVQTREDEACSSVECAREKARFAGEEELAATRIRAKTILDDAHKQADELLIRARNEFEEEKLAARESMREEAASLAILIAEKLIERKFDDEDNKTFIEKCIKGGDGA